MNHIEFNADTRGGKPRIAGTRITVADVVLMHRRLGRALEEIAVLPPSDAREST